jgi:riboflavin kinase/FMN adenylyltransferase
VGPEFRFGKGRTGDLALLQSMGAIRGFTAHEIAPVLADDGERVSSSRIRAALDAGDLRHGRPSCSVVPTRSPDTWCVASNSDASSAIRPRTCATGGKTPALRGIYATWVHGPGDDGRQRLQLRHAAHGVGHRVLLEAHLFDFDGDLYGRRIEVEFVAKLRDEVKFADLDSLVAQMHATRQTHGQILARRASSVETWVRKAPYIEPYSERTRK